MSATVPHHVVQIGFSLLVTLPSPPECLDYRHVGPHHAATMFFNLQLKDSLRYLDVETEA